MLDCLSIRTWRIDIFTNRTAPLIVLYEIVIFIWQLISKIVGIFISELII
jgi:hypothetical protein